jgi:polyhydroxybutyrate depolymerase
MKLIATTCFYFYIISLCAQSTGTIQHDGLERTFAYFVPDNLPSTPVPLVFVLHGTTQDGEGIMNISEFNSFAENNDFIVVYPDGVDGFWNADLGAVGSNADDVGFIEALVSKFNVDYNIDLQKLYSTGFSAGGYLSYILACQSEYCFAAVASVAGTMTQNTLDACNPIHATAVMQIHGTSDFVVGYNGSQFAGLGVDQIIEYWGNTNGCAADPILQDIPNSNLLDLSTVQKYTWLPCDGSSELVLFRIDGGGHQWPGTNATLGGLGPINRDINATEEIWAFFSQHSCPSELVSTEEIFLPQITIFPNPTRDFVYLKNVPNDRSVSLSIYDQTGRRVLSTQVASNSIDVSALENGIYTVFISDTKNPENIFVQQSLLIFDL